MPQKAFRVYNKWGLYSGLIKATFKAAAFNIRAKINKNTFAVNFEKVTSEAKEADRVINNALRKRVKEKWNNYKFVNRKEDFGKT